MEHLPWIIYFIDVICGEWFGVGFILFMLLFSTGVCLIVKPFIKQDYVNELAGDPHDKSAAEVYKIFNKLPLKMVFTTSLLIMFIGNFIPSKETAYKMLAAYGVNAGVEALANNEDVKDIMGDGVDILKLTLKDYKQRLEDKTNKGDKHEAE